MNPKRTNLQKPFSSPKPVNTRDKTPIRLVTANSHPQATLFSLAQHKRSYHHRYRDPVNLKPWQVDELHQADAFAAEIGLPLNYFITITWRLTDTGKLDSAVFQHGVRLMRQWLADNSAQTAWVYVHENPESTYGDEMPNSHVLLHLPRHIRRGKFVEMLERWFDAWDGGIKATPRGEYLWGKFQVDRRIQYMTKGADGFTCKRYGGWRKRGGQGVVEIKRAGTSQNIGAAARQRKARVA